MLAAFVGLLTGLVLALVAAEVYSGAGWLSSRIVRSAVKRLPDDVRAIREEEWLAELAAFDGLQLSKLFWSVGIYAAALKLKFRYTYQKGKEKKQRRSASERKASPLMELLYEVLQSDEMTRRLSRLLVALTISLAVVLVPLTAIAILVMFKFSLDFKYAMGSGSAMLVTLTSRLARRIRKRRSIKPSSTNNRGSG